MMQMLQSDHVIASGWIPIMAKRGMRREERKGKVGGKEREGKGKRERTLGRQGGREVGMPFWVGGTYPVRDGGRDGRDTRDGT